MHRSFFRLLTAGFLLFAAQACDDDDDPAGIEPAEGAIVTFAFEATNDTIDVWVLDSATIAQARQRVETGSGPRMPVGPIVRGNGGIDERFAFHFVPSQVRLADLAMEVCDGRPMRTAAEVNEFFQLSTGNANAEQATWCPWGAKPIAVRAP